MLPSLFVAKLMNDGTIVVLCSSSVKKWTIARKFVCVDALSPSQQLFSNVRSGPDWPCGQDQIGLFLKIDLATGNHGSQFHL